MKKTTLLLLILIIFSSCSDERPTNVTVFIDSDFIQKNTVIIDNTIKLEQFYKSEKIFNEFNLKTGKHSVLINDSMQKEFIVKGDSGILNIAQREFIVYPIEYASDDYELKSNTCIRYPVIIDSLIIYDPYVAKDQAHLLKKLHEPSFKEQFKKKRGKINKNLLFIEKTWDFGVDESSPDKINVNKNVSAFANAYKLKITTAEQFLLYAMYSEDYKVELIEYEELKHLVENF